MGERRVITPANASIGFNRAVESISSMPSSFSTGATAPIKPSVFLDGSLASSDKNFRIGHDAPGKNLRVLDLTRHDGVGHAGILHQADALAELTERDPMDRRARLRGGFVEIGECFFFCGDDRDVMAHRTGSVQHKEWEPAISRDEA